MDNQGDKLKRFIRNNSYSQKEFAEKVGVAPNYISMMIKGTKPISDAFLLSITKVIPGADLSMFSNNIPFSSRATNYKKKDVNRENLNAEEKETLEKRLSTLEQSQHYLKDFYHKEESDTINKLFG